MRAQAIARRLGGGGLAAAAAAALLATGCGSAAPATPAPAVAHGAPVAAAPPVPAMVMVTFTDRGYRASDVSVQVSRPAMLMLYDSGSAEHRLHAVIPLVGLQIEGFGVSVQSAADATASAVDATVTSGQETDVTFTPTQLGRYPVVVDGVDEGALVVTP